MLAPDEIRLLLSWYAEDVLRAVEMEVKGLEARIRLKYPEARYIELEPDGAKNLRASEALRYAIDIGSSGTEIKKKEIERLHSLEKYFTELKHTESLRKTIEYSRSENDSSMLEVSDNEMIYDSSDHVSNSAGSGESGITSPVTSYSSSGHTTVGTEVAFLPENSSHTFKS